MENRVIKFRAWHEGKNKMFSPEEMGRDQLTIMPDGQGFINVHGGHTSLSSLLPYMIPMQFTGLLDKNGVEIYEGDIVVHDGDECVVNFKGGTFGIDFQETARKPYDRILYSTNWQVIGNIYQHPEILAQLEAE